ncbi:MAG: TrmJ/YjtD family RNA methyltransferase [Treponema sp.]|jgi:tRNA/rRNA methyltransferase/tRNA (cytidine32/uridine32-2'-O)-methyltransferase|nr:TrmJ/YjtD family RNA methyltransferase [Treponema sp.]
MLSDIIIILVRPEEAGNVGAVCRAMKNCGISRLRLVNPNELHEGTIRARAVHAEDVWHNAERFTSLEGALADCSLIIGTTRRRGHRRKAVTMPPDEAAAFLKDRNGNAALLFGNERTGLEDYELDLCSIASHIPVSADFPSLNLSHAVQIYGYELFKTLSDVQPVVGQWIPMNNDQIGILARSVTNSLESLGFYKQQGREYQERFFRDVFSRAGLSEREGEYMSDIFAKTARLIVHKAE